MTDKNNGKRPIIRAEKFKNYCIGLGALSALLLGIWANVKGEPKADKTWDTAQEKLNKHREAINKLGDGMRKLHLMFVHMQGQNEGYNNAKLMLRIEGLEKENEKLRGGVPVVKVLRGSKVVESKLKACPPGWVRVKGRCTKSRVKIAKAVDDARMKARETAKKLIKERKLRKAAERAKAQMQQIRIPEPRPPAKLDPVPKSLDKASKSNK